MPKHLFSINTLNVLKTKTVKQYFLLENLRWYTTILLLFLFSSLQAQMRTETITGQLKWATEEVRITEQEVFVRLGFTGAVYGDDQYAPLWQQLVPHQQSPMRHVVVLKPGAVAGLTAVEAAAIAGSNTITNDFRVESARVTVRKVHYTSINVFPIRKRADGSFEKLLDFTLELTAEPIQQQPASQQRRKGVSVLATGDWNKLRVTKTGLYKLDYQQLASMGLSGSGASALQLYGMGGALLPERAGATRPDGLQEIAIWIVDGGDNSIDAGDYVVFFGEGAGKWVYDSVPKRWNYQKHSYSESNFYYLTKGNTAGLRIQQQAPPSGSPSMDVTTFQDYQRYENDSLSLIKSGKIWLGEEFDLRTSYQFSFNFPNIDPLSPVEVLSGAAARSVAASHFTVQSGLSSAQIPIYTISVGYNSQYAFYGSKAFTFNTSGNTIPVTVTYSKPLTSSVGWLDYIQVNLRRSLKLTGGQMAFRDGTLAGTGNIVRYKIEQASGTTAVWDVSDPFSPEMVQGTLAGTTFEFLSDASQMREFVAHNGSGYFTPDLSGKVANQNLAGVPPQDYIIVSHPDFLAAANRLADLHRTKSNLTCMVVTPAMIYNEFSSGKQDPAAIRDFMKMLYDRAATPKEMPKYLLLFGDGSFDNLNRVSENTNFIPTYQSDESFHPAYTYVTDDFYGMLDDTEGINGAGHLDLGIGRIPVATAAEAMYMVDKIVRYTSDNTQLDASSICAGAGNTKPLADWRNTICLVADDEDSNLHIDQAENLSIFCDTTYTVYNFNKIFIDAYQQLSISGGHRYPEVNSAINKQLERGALVLNYIGHGGELGWAHERILRIDDILSWTNAYHMPLMLTSTCEFSRFDDPARRSAGEYAYLMPNGGAIAMFTTTRLAFASSNYAFNTAFYKQVFKKENNEYPRLGDIFMWSKINSGSQSSNRNMVILGDPALMLAYPMHRVITTHINDSLVSAPTDTLKALSKVTISGAVTDNNGQVLQNFNGILYPTVFDKKATYTTQANDPGSYKREFWMQKNTLYKGKVSVTNGLFSFSFIVPKDIAYAYGYGKISYYAENGTEDAHGYYDKIMVGGTDEGSVTDLQGPEVKLYMNDSSFVYGGTTDPNPVIFAVMRDEYGINTTGGGIGHDIVAVLDGNTNHSIILNDYYESDLDSYNSGTVSYGLTDLAEGPHHLSLKVWDIFNNSTEVHTEFIVASSDKPVLAHVLNYPNPFTTYTEFWFEHNQACCDLDVMVEVFTLSGKIVKTIRETVSTVGFRADPIPWDGLDDYGDRLARGVYVYKVTVRNKELKQAEKFEKLVILR